MNAAPSCDTDDAQLERELDAIFGPARPLEAAPKSVPFPPMSNTNTNANSEAAAAALLPVIRIALSDIVPDPKNRKGHDPVAIASLAETLRVDGQLQPIVVRKLAPREDVKAFEDDNRGHCVVEGAVGDLKPIFVQLPTAGVARNYAAVYRRGGYMIVAGERRWTAAGTLAWETIEARVQDDAKTSLQSVRARAAENLHREDLSCIEEAEVYQQLAAEGMSQAEIAAFAGKKSASTISNSLRLLKLPEVVRGLLKDGCLDRAYGVSLCRFAAWPKIVEHMAKQLLGDEHMTQKQFEKEKLPYNYELRRKGLIAEIETPPYTIPANDPDYFQTYSWEAHCFVPEKWAEEKKRQDGVNAAKAAAAAQREAKKGAKSGLSEKELAERRRVIEANKAKKAKTTATWLSASQAIRDGKVPESVLAAWVLGALTSSWGYRRIKEGFDRAGVLPPKDVLPGETSYGMQSPETMQKLSGRQLLGVAASIVLARDVEQAIKNAFDCPDSVEDIARFHEIKGETDPKILGEWAKAYGKGMSVEEIARSYKAPLADVCGALAVPVPTMAARAAAGGEGLPLFAKGPTPVQSVVVLGGNRGGKTALAAQVVKAAKAKGVKVAEAKPVPRGKASKKGRGEVTAEVKEKVKTLTHAGRTLAEISKTLKISVPAAFRIRKELGLVKAGKGAK